MYGGEKKPRKLKVKENAAPKGIIITDIKNLFEQEQENYYKPVRAGNFYSNNYIEYNYCYKNNYTGYRNKTLSVKEYLHNIKPYFKDIINNRKEIDTWKVQLIRPINSFSSNDRVMYSRARRAPNSFKN